MQSDGFVHGSSEYKFDGFGLGDGVEAVVIVVVVVVVVVEVVVVVVVVVEVVVVEGVAVDEDDKT